MPRLAVPVFLIVILASVSALADSSSPKLAAYYDRQMAIVAGKVYAWEGDDPPATIPVAARQVGVGRDRYYALTDDGDLIAFDDITDRHAVLMQGVTRFAAGHTGVLAIAEDRTLWWLSG